MKDKAQLAGSLIIPFVVSALSRTQKSRAGADLNFFSEHLTFLLGKKGKDEKRKGQNMLVWKS